MIPTAAASPAISKPRPWRPADSIALLLVTVVAAVVRGRALTRPAGLVFDEFFYATDACRYVRESADLCGFGDFTYFHPPLAKWIMAMGIQSLGPNRLGWRAPAVVFGTLTVVVLFLLGRRLLRSTVGATVTSGVLALDLLHLVHSRLAMLDIFSLFFATATVLCAVADRQDDSDRFVRPWRVATGVCIGATIACKWTGGLIVIAVVAIMALWVFREARVRWRRELASFALWLLLLPVLVYMLSYVGRLDGSLFMTPWAMGAWFREFFELHYEMVAYQTRIKDLFQGGLHPSSSPAWTWPLLKRPMVYFFSVEGRTYQEILAFGNPVSWWPAVGAMFYVAVRLVRGRTSGYEGTILACFLAAWLPWMVLSTGGPDPYLFYFLFALPFLYLGLGYAAGHLWASLSGRIATVGLGLAVLATFTFFYPIVTAQPLTISEWRDRMWFRYCNYSPNTTINARLKEVDLPVVAENLEDLPAGRIAPTRTRARGWCWI